MASSKKITKVPTPIDEKETFVSLQKNFADSDLSVEEKLRILYELQQADSAIDKLAALRGELPGEVARYEEKLLGINNKVEELKAGIKEYELAIKANKTNIEECKAETAKYEAQLKEAQNSREFDSIMKEIENLTLVEQIAYKNIRSCEEKIESAKNSIQVYEEKIVSCQADLDAKKEELENIVESTAKEEEKLQKTRQACAAKIDGRTMSAYNRIRESAHNHLAVVPVFESSCGGCFSEITPQRLIDIESGTKLVICEHCGRILVNAKKEEQQ